MTEEQQKAIAAIQQKKSEEQLEYKEMMKELDETFQKRMEAVLTDEQTEKYKSPGKHWPADTVLKRITH